MLDRSERGRTTLTATVVLVLVALTAVLLTTRGTGDIGIWERWTRNAMRLGVVDGFRANDNDYPPISNIVLWVTGQAAAAADVPLPTAIKYSLLLFLAATLVIFFDWTRRPMLTLGLWAAMALNAAGMGYLDIYAMPLLLLSLRELQEGEGSQALGWFCAACLVKWQPAVIGPFVALHLALSLGPIAPRRWRAYVRMAVPALVLAGLAVLVFHPYPMFRAFAKSLGHRILSGDTLNLAWVGTWILQGVNSGISGLTSQVASLPNGPVVWRLAFKIIFACQFAWLLYRFYKGPVRFERTLAYSCVGFLAYVALSSGVHENHWFVPSVLAIALVPFRADWRAPAIAVAIISNVNLLLFYGWNGRGLEMSRVVGIDVSVPIAALCVAAYVWILKVLIRLDAEGWKEPATR